MADIRLADIKLAAPAPALLKKAKEQLVLHRDVAQAHNNISTWVAVGQYDTEVMLGLVCHAQMYHICNARRLKKVSKKTGKGTDPRPRYRYLVNFTNPWCKPQYWAGKPECMVPFSGERRKAVRAWYDFLHNRSHWSRFFVGSRDINTLLNYGHILDLSAPSFVIHFMSVAWRMPGEFVQQVDSWYELVKKGIEPHLAFGMAMYLGGWDDPTGQIETLHTPGHALMGTMSIDGLARMAFGVAAVMGGDDVKPAYRYYSSSCNMHYEGGKGKKWYKDPGLLSIPGVGTYEQIKDPWGGFSERTTLNASAFATVFSPGTLRVMNMVAVHARKKGWI